MFFRLQNTVPQSVGAAKCSHRLCPCVAELAVRLNCDLQFVEFGCSLQCCHCCLKGGFVDGVPFLVPYLARDERDGRCVYLRGGQVMCFSIPFYFPPVPPPFFSFLLVIRPFRGCLASTAGCIASSRLPLQPVSAPTSRFLHGE